MRRKKNEIRNTQYWWIGSCQHKNANLWNLNRNCWCCTTISPTIIDIHYWRAPTRTEFKSSALIYCGLTCEKILMPWIDQEAFDISANKHIKELNRRRRRTLWTNLIRCVILIFDGLLKNFNFFARYLIQIT